MERTTKLFCYYKTNGFFWFRILGYGLCFKNIHKKYMYEVTDEKIKKARLKLAKMSEKQKWELVRKGYGMWDGLSFSERYGFTEFIRYKNWVITAI